MTAVEVVAISLLWVVLLGLAGLVLMLYRQVDKAYAGAGGSDTAALLPGVEAPDIEILSNDDDGVAPLRFPASDEIGLLAFVSTECAACHDLLKVLGDRRLEVGRRIALVNGEDTDPFREGWRGVELEWLAHPPDVVRTYGVTQVPYVYAVKGTTILASAGATERDALAALVADARARAENANGNAEGAAAR